jgi:large subunit ribosomal protein L25
MENVTLKATHRAEQGKGPSRRLRAQGKIPTVAYGEAAKSTLSLAIEHDALLTVLGSEKGRNTVIHLDVEGDKNYPVMVRDFSIHPISRRLLHADFITVDENVPIEVDIPFVTTGKSKGEADGGTVLVAMRRLPVRCLPASIPARISADVTLLEMEDGIKVKELNVPPGVEILVPGDRRIVVVKAPKMVEEAKPEAAVEGEGAATAAAAPAATAATAAPAKKGKEG